MLWILMNLLLVLLHIVNAVCPIDCICKQDYIDCSNKQLTSITNNLLLEFFHAGSVQDPSDNVRPVKFLNLANNQLKELPTVLVSESLPHLLSLDLSNNRITQITSIQSVVLSKYLLHLRLSSNPIQHLGNNTDTVLYSQSISHLDLSNCNINSITHPGTFMFMLNLTHLDLSGNPLVVVDHLVSNTLRYLDLSRCMLGYIDKGLRDEALTDLSSLYSLNISMNPHFTRFPVSKPLSTTLSFLDASFCALEKLHLKLFPYLKQAIFKGNIIKVLHNYTLSNNNNLQILDISENSIYQIERFSFSSCRSLEELDLSRNLLSSFDWSTLLETPQLRTLNISRNLLTTLNDLPPLSLTTIDASQCDISLLSQHLLEKAINVKYLNLSHNSLEYVTKSLTTSRVTYLDLSFCRISDFETGPYTGLSNLLNLNLMGNRLTNPLKQNVLDHLSQVKDLNLINNPWHCDCNDPDFKKFWKYILLSQAKSNYTKSLICQSPKELRGLSWEKSCLEHLGLHEESMSKNKALFSLLLPLITLFCLLSVILVIRQGFFSHHLEHRQRDIQSSRSTEDGNRRFHPRSAPHVIDDDLERGIHLSLNEASERSQFRELSKLPSYEEALLLPKPQSREDLKKIVKKYEDTDRFERTVNEDSQSVLQSDQPSTSEH